jgi:hypothetical protein
MKNTLSFIFSSVMLMFGSSCAKNLSIVNPVPISAVTVVNAVIGSSALIPDFSVDSVEYFSSALTVPFAGFHEYSVPSGMVPLNIYQITDTTNTTYKGTLDLAPNRIYTFFLCGADIQNGQSSSDTLFTLDNPPYHDVTDSVVGVRFVNLLADGNPISVNIKGIPYGSEVSSLTYKGVSSFQNYGATSSIGSYAFEFRDAMTDTLWASYTLSGINNSTSTVRFRNVTLVLSGRLGGTGSTAISAFLVNNY